MENYDAVVIGAGQGGGPIPHKFADMGQRVALIEREHLGGSCINYGCTPTNAMIASAASPTMRASVSSLNVKAA